jgi:hypothetical protein
MAVTRTFELHDLQDQVVVRGMAADLQRARLIAQIMDSQFSLLGIRFGADALIGLVPVIGDTLSILPALYPLYVARRHRLGNRLLLRMGWNIGLDWLIGLLPVIGDVLDVASKSNIKNVRLLEDAVKRQTKRASEPNRFDQMRTQRRRY